MRRAPGPDPQPDGRRRAGVRPGGRAPPNGAAAAARGGGGAARGPGAGGGRRRRGGGGGGGGAGGGGAHLEGAPHGGALGGGAGARPRVVQAAPDGPHPERPARVVHDAVRARLPPVLHRVPVHRGPLAFPPPPPPPPARARPSPTPPATVGQPLSPPASSSGSLRSRYRQRGESFSPGTDLPSSRCNSMRSAVHRPTSNSNELGTRPSLHSPPPGDGRPGPADVASSLHPSLLRSCGELRESRKGWGGGSNGSRLG